MKKRTKKVKRTRRSRAEKTAVIAVDVQRDFLPGGALAVRNGNEVIEPLVELIEDADFVVATRDWHPQDHVSFEAQGGPWPEHCVAYEAPQTMEEAMLERGADIHAGIEKFADLVVSKATQSEVEAYSDFEGTGLADALREQGIKRVVIGGLATDYCVKATAIDAVEAGFDVVVVKDACRAVNANEGDEDMAYAEMQAAGISIRSDEQV